MADPNGLKAMTGRPIRAATVRERGKRRFGCVAGHRFLTGAARMTVAFFLSSGPAFADEIITRDRSIQRIQIVGLNSGDLVYRDETGLESSFPVADAIRIIVHSVGDLRDFSQAEEYLADGQPEEAIVRYQRALRLARGFWVPIVHLRMLQASDGTARFDRTLGQFLWLLHSPLAGPGVASRVLPRGLPVSDGEAARSALKRIVAAAPKSNSDDSDDLLILLRFAVLDSIADGSADAVAMDVASRPLGQAIASVRAYEIKLAALGRARRAGHHQVALRGLDQAMELCPRQLLPELLIAKGELMLEAASDRGELLLAASTLMRVPIHFTEHALAGRGLRLTGEIHDRLGRPEQAVALLEECLRSKSLPDAERSAARADLDRIRGTNQASPR